MAKPSKKKPGDDDELFPDTGVKPAKKPTKKVEKPAAVEKPKKTETKKVEKPVEKAEKPVEKAEKPEPRPTPAPAPAPRSTPAPAASGGSKKLIFAGLALVAIGGLALVVGPVLLKETDETRRPKPPQVANVPSPQAPAVTAAQPKPTEPVKPVVQPTLKATPAATPMKPEKLVPFKPNPAAASKSGKPLKELADKTATHGAIARILELFDGVRKVDFNSDSRLFEDYQAKQAREKELLEQIRALGPAGLDALKDILLNVNDDGYKIFLAKALGGMNDPLALKTAADILTGCKDIAVQTTLVRFLPDTADATNIIAGAFSTEENPNVRSMLLREYARRISEPTPENADPNAQGLSDQARAIFRQAALQDPDPNVRAEAVSIIGHRGDARDMDLMAQIAKGEQNLQIRQSAIVAYATTGQDTALPFLEDLAQHEDSLEIRASAVLAIARVGNDRAIQILDQIAQTDPREEIKTRAAGFAASLRAKQQSDQNERRGIDAQPVPLGPRRRGG